MTALLEVPGLAEPARPKKLSYSERVLESGLRVVAVRRPTVPLVEVRLRVPFFSARARHRARSALLAGTIRTGTAEHDRLGLAEALGDLGAELSVGADPDRLLLSASAIASGLPALLGLYAEILTSASYPNAEVGGERGRLLERITMSRSQAGVMAGEALAQRMAPGHPYGRTLPDEQEVAATTAAQLRTLHAGMVRPDGALLVIVGDISPARALAAAESALAGWTGAAPAGKVAPPPPVAGGPLRIVDRPGSVQTAFRFGGPGLPRQDERYPALQLANLVFGGFISSRWVENIRERRGFSYSPRSALDHEALRSSFLISADVATEVSAPALLETLYELGRMASGPVTEAELETVRQYAIGTLAISTATQSGLASTVANLLGAGVELEWLSSHPARLARVTVADVAEVAAEFLAPRRLVGVAVGDAGAITAPLAGIVEVE
ncbi:M16 family metallopeptidase [Jatrophihabitans sp.]|uniref:M16 family metallopeptidase n=1 Tax=Jatrophihabitans sp. TaxID=1932789 RepID=UPI002C11C2F5|nr:pitrilysin family protein [Jatrophihabitans sp.]